MEVSTDEKETRNLDLGFYEYVILLNSFMSLDYLSSIVEYADPVYFENPNVRIILKHVLKFFTDTGTVPTLTEVKTHLIEDEQRAFGVIVDQFKKMDSKFNREELLSNTERFLKERGLQKTILETASRFDSGEADAGTILTEFEKIYNINLKENMGHWYFEEVDRHIKELTTLYNPMRTGWKFLDDKLEGGLYPKTLTCFLGQVNVGKSIFLGNIATNLVRDNRNTLLISLEMSEFMYAKRISSQITQIPHGQLKTYTSELKTQLEEVGKSLDSKLVIKEYPPKSITVRQIDGYISKLIHKGFKPDVVVIDYINLIKPSTKNLNTYEGVKEVAEQLRAIAFKYGIPIITATQVNRSGWDVAPGMENISESIGLAATCDVMCSIWQGEEEKELGVINLEMIKNRFGVNFGCCPFKIEYETLTLTETDPDHFAGNDRQDVVNSAEGTLNKLLGDN